jgi:hypothetical protein
MSFLRLKYVAVLAIIFALARPALADDEEMGGMDSGGGEMGGMDGGGDWGLGGLIDGAIDSFSNGGGYDSGYYDPGYQGGYDYPSYPSYPVYPNYGGGYAPASGGSSYAPQVQAPPPANRLPPRHSIGTAMATAAPPANPLPRHRASDKPKPTDVAIVDTKTPTNRLPRHHESDKPKPTESTVVDTDLPEVPRHAEAPSISTSSPPESPSDGTVVHINHPEVPAEASRPIGSIALTVDEDIVDEQQRQDPVVRRLLDAIPNQQAVDVLVAQLPNPPYNERLKSDIRRAVNEGNLTELQRLNQGVNSAAFTRLVQIATAVQAVNRVADRARNGTLTQTDIQNALTALRPFTNGNPQLANAVQRDLTSLLSSSNTIARFRDALRRLRPVVVSSPITQPRRPISSSARPVFAARQPVVARIPAALPAMAPVPATSIGSVAAPAPAVAAAPTPAAMLAPPSRTTDSVASIVLMNADQQTSVRYTANDEQHEMKPGFEHSLSGGSQWLIKFDRGDDFGIAHYTLISGRYKFVITERGWDLVKAESLGSAPAAAAQPALDDQATLEGR